MRDAHYAYYQRAILPLCLQTDRPDYALVIGCFGGGLAPTIFTTSRLAFNRSSDYEAVGVGASVANSWLGRLYDKVPIQFAVKLAAYVIYQVKASVGGCGLGTDIAIVRPEGLLESVSARVIRKWEDVFRYYPALERNIFHYCVGLEYDEKRLYRTRIGKDPIESDLREIRKLLTQVPFERAQQPMRREQLLHMGIKSEDILFNDHPDGVAIIPKFILQRDEVRLVEDQPIPALIPPVETGDSSGSLGNHEQAQEREVGFSAPRQSHPSAEAKVE